MTYGEAESNLILDRLINQWAIDQDAGQIADQLQLMAPDGTYRVYQGDQLVTETAGHENLTRQFTTATAARDQSFTMNGTHLITVNQNDGTATGIVYAQVKVVTARDNQRVVTDYSVRYRDQYAFLGANWVIQERDEHRVIVDQHPLHA
ncbi:nuclear transport factor 2 family protein [Levilactobacillus spicheri]